MKKPIYYFLSSVAAAALMTFAGCSSTDTPALPKIDGFNNSDEVAATNLVAKWNLDGDPKESISGNVGVISNVTYATGKVGKCAVLNGGYIYNATIPNLATKVTSNVSISLWAQVRNNQELTNHATALASLTGDVSTTPLDVTPASILLETGHFKSISDTVRVKSIVGVTKSSGNHGLEDNVNWWGLDNINNPGQMVKIPKDTWAHFVLVWDNTNKTIRLYVNKKLATNSEWEVKTGANFKVQTKLGMIIGGFNNNVGLNTATDSWAKAMEGKVDQVRVYNTTLTVAQISALYNLEDVGR
jgi:Concanavalin A-like lectin/glucanases superfamily